MLTRTTRFLLAATLAAGLASPADRALAQGSAAPVTPAAGVADLQRWVGTLASDQFGGRQAGTDGERLAGNFLAAELTKIGVKPLPGRSDLFASFRFTSGSRDGGSTLAVDVPGARAATWRGTATVQALSFSDDASVSGPLVFAGYGLVVPESQGVGYDSYAALDVKDKIVVVLRYFPEDADPKMRAVLARYADLRYKAMAARQHGAKALLVVTGPRSPNAGQTVPLTFDTALAGSGIPAASLGGQASTAIFSGAPKTLAAVQQELDSGNPHVAGFPLRGTATLTTKLVREQRTARNILGYLPATTPTTPEKAWVAIGAHYDHLGRGDQGTSLAAKDEAGMIHHGADDNASGSSAVLAIASRLAVGPRPRHVLVALWSAEEIGLVGSAAYVNAPAVPLADTAAYFNFDMVGRMQDNKLVVQAAGTAATWPRILERANVAAGFDLTVQPDPYQPTDVASFNQVSVPSLAFSTGSHPDYHKPSDTADRINYPDLERLVGFATAIVRATADTPMPPQFVKVDQPTSQAASMAGVRVTTGTIPDYTSNVKGLLLGGVIGGGPAEQAGLTKGDVIVEIAGQTIANIYDYTYALELLKVNQPVKVVYERAGMRRETTLTPGARR